MSVLFAVYCQHRKEYHEHIKKSINIYGMHKIMDESDSQHFVE